MEKTTHTVWGILDGDGPFEGIKMDFGRNCMLFEVSQDTDDGTYPRLCDWMRDANALDREGASHFLNRLTRKKDKTRIDFEGVTIVRDSKWSNEATLEFKEPIWVVMGRVGTKPVVQLVKKIKGEFTHDWFWTRNGRQSKIANGYEIWFVVQEYAE